MKIVTFDCRVPIDHQYTDVWKENKATFGVDNQQNTHMGSTDNITINQIYIKLCEVFKLTSQYDFTHMGSTDNITINQTYIRLCDVFKLTSQYDLYQVQ